MADANSRAMTVDAMYPAAHVGANADDDDGSNV
jgi:hypothetical protein